MGSIRLGVGTEWLQDGRTFRIVRQPGPEQFVVLDLRFNVESQQAGADILASFAGGQLRFKTAADESFEGGPELSRNLVGEGRMLSADEQALVRERWEALGPLGQTTGTPAQADFERRAAELAAGGRAVSARTLRRYWLTWRRHGNDRRALASRTLSCGGRGRSRRHSLLSRSPVLRKLVDDAIKSVYLTTARRPISAVVRRAFEDLQRHNARVSTVQVLPVPRPGSLARSVARRIAQLDPYEIDKARWGRRIAEQRHRHKTPQRLASRILERVEIDHSPLKVVVGTKAGPLGQPWLTILIDYYSRMIVGFCIGFEPPSYAVLMEALRHAILPKTYVAARYPRITGSWPCFGLPERLVCDRGSDLTSSDLERAAFQLGIELDFMPPRTPHFKGTVESFFDNLNDQLISSLPGRTFRSWEKRADYSADDGPLLPYESLVEIVHLHLIDVYSRQKHPTAPLSRLEIWQESAAEFPPALPASPADLLVLLAKSVERSLTVRGIELGGMFYASDELMALRATLAANNLPADRLTVRYNPWDLGAIWVLNPLDRSYLQAAAVDAALQGLTEYQWRVLRRAVRQPFEQPDHLLGLAAARNNIRDLVEQTVHQPSRRRRVKAARFSGQFQQQPEANRPPDGLDESSLASGSDQESADAPHCPAPENAPAEANEIDVDDWDVAF